MKSKRSRLMLAIIAMSCISLYGCGTAEDNAAVDNISKLESDQSEQLVKNDSEIETEVDSVDELSETDVEAQEDDVEVESADNEEEEPVSHERSMENVELIEVDGEYAVTKNRDGVIFRVKCSDLEKKKVGKRYIFEYALSEAEEIEENVCVIEVEDLYPAQPLNSCN